MIYLLISERLMTLRGALDACPGVKAFPVLYPERLMLHTGYEGWVRTVIARHENTGSELIVTDSPDLVNLFRVMVHEGHLRAEQVVVAELHLSKTGVPKVLDYRVNDQGRFEGVPPPLFHWRFAIEYRMREE